jgi:phage terminase large subunit-like protein
MHNNGHPVLAWQAGNVTVKEDVNKNKRPVKQKRGDYRTIDGIVAGIMALSRAMLLPVNNPYDTRGIIAI